MRAERNGRHVRLSPGTTTYLLPILVYSLRILPFLTVQAKVLHEFNDRQSEGVNLAWFKNGRIIFTNSVRQWRMILPTHSCGPPVNALRICKAEFAENEPCRKFHIAIGLGGDGPYHLPHIQSQFVAHNRLQNGQHTRMQIARYRIRRQRSDSAHPGPGSC